MRPASIGSEGSKALIAEFSKLSEHDIERHSKKYPARAKVDAQLLEGWRTAAGDPDHWVYRLLRDGAPAGIKHTIKDPGIFPACPRSAELQPENIYCNEQ